MAEKNSFMRSLDQVRKMTEILHENILGQIFSRHKISRDDAVINMFCENVSFLPELLADGYLNLYGSSTDQDVYNFAQNTKIRYFWVKDERTHFPGSFFSALICPFGKMTPKCIREIATILKDLGLLVVVFKNTSDKFAENHNLFLGSSEVDRKNGEWKFEKILDSISYDKDKLLSILILHKHAVKLNLPQTIHIVSNSEREGGISKHVQILRHRLESELGISSPPGGSVDIKNSVVVVEYHPQLESEKNLLKSVAGYISRGNVLFIEVHSILGVSQSALRFLEKNVRLLYRSNESAAQDGAKIYTLMPVIAYATISRRTPKPKDSVILGTFGYPFAHKGLEEIIALSNREKIPLNMYLTVNEESLSNKAVTRRELARLTKMDGKYAKIITEYYDDDKLADLLTECSHLIFGNKGGFDASGTMQFAKRLSLPIISIDSLQSRLAMAHRFVYFSSRRQGIWREFRILTRRIYSMRFFKGSYDTVSHLLTQFVKTSWMILFCRRLTKPIISGIKGLSKEEDGLIYLRYMLENQA